MAQGRTATCHFHRRPPEVSPVEGLKPFECRDFQQLQLTDKASLATGIDTEQSKWRIQQGHFKAMDGLRVVLGLSSGWLVSWLAKRLLFRAFGR